MMNHAGQSRGVTGRPRGATKGILMRAGAAIAAAATLLCTLTVGAAGANAASGTWARLSAAQKQSSYGYFVWKSENAGTQAAKDAAAKAANVLRGVYTDDLTSWGSSTNRNALAGYTKIGENGDATTLENMRQAIVGLRQINDFRSSLSGEPCRTDMRPTFDVCGSNTNHTLTPYRVTDVMMAMAQLDANWMAAQKTYDTLHAGVFSVAENGAWPVGASGTITMSGTAAAQQWYSEKSAFDKGAHDASVGHYANLTNKGWGSKASDVKLTEYTVSGLGIVTRSTPGAVGANWGANVTQDYSSVSPWGPQVGPTSSVDAYLADFDKYVELINATPDGCTTPFWDVDSGTSHREDITWLACQKISTGFGDGTFGPMRTVVRGDMAAFLYRLAGSPSYSPSGEDRARFTDVNDGTPHHKEIWWLAKEGIANGFDDHSFGPMRTVVRQDMAAFLKRLADYRKADSVSGVGVSFSDVDGSTPHAKDIQWLAKTGVTTGWKMPGGTYEFRGMNDVVRQDMAAFLHRMSTNVLK